MTVEIPVPLIGEVRQPIPAQLGPHERYDDEHRRNGCEIKRETASKDVHNRQSPRQTRLR